jgi:tRNA threonylcarbamoyladenosine biosynthesis protein TsaB
MNVEQKLLLIDTCGETAGVALCRRQEVIASEDLARGSASAGIISALRLLLEEVGWQLADVDAVGVVNGPGSFTGMRTGLATAKGLCEAGGLMLAAVSRLEVLADAASAREGIALLDAGRGEVYVRDVASGQEHLASSEDLDGLCKGRGVMVAEARLAERLAGYRPVLYPLHVTDSVHAVLRRLQGGGSDVGLIDANYVRGESELYRKQGQAAIDPSAGTQ